MTQGAFDIYRTPGGVTAVTNPVQRHILAALQDGDKQLPELVELTGKAKPTLSGVHMKELLNRELIVEMPHPSDSRRKLFRLNAEPMGTSGVPVDQLRSAVKEYAAGAFGAIGPPLDAVFRVLAAAPARTGDQVLLAQAKALGAACAARLEGNDGRSFAASLAQFVEQEGLATHLQIDYESLSFRCRPGDRVQEVPAGRMGLLLAGFAEGAAQARGIEAAFSSKDDGDAFRLKAA